MNNFHTHTYRCGHAQGTEREMIEAAITEGYTSLGFSEHVPLPHIRYTLIKALLHSKPNIVTYLRIVRGWLRNGFGTRMVYNDLDDYLDTLVAFKEAYKPQIDIKIGFECEYFRDYLPYYKRLKNDPRVDYLILGHHYDRYPIGTYYYGNKHLTHQQVKTYVDDCIEAMDTGLFSYIAHPDLIFIGLDHSSPFLDHQLERLILHAKKTKTPLEVNAGGERRGKQHFDRYWNAPYPHPYFFKLVSKHQAKVIIGLDAHQPEDLNHEIYHEMEAFIKQYDISQTTTIFSDD